MYTSPYVSPHPSQDKNKKDVYKRQEDIRFTVKGDSIYAFVMQYPEDGVLTIRSLADSKDQNVPEFHGLIEQIRVLGFDKANVQWKTDSEGLHLSLIHI